jgi:hypothetical protein
MEQSLIPDSKPKTRPAPPKINKREQALRKARHKKNVSDILSGAKSVSVLMLDGSECQMKVTTKTDTYVILTAPNGDTFGIDLIWEKENK